MGDDRVMVPGWAAAVFRWLPWLAVAAGIAVLAITFSHPLAEPHGFRQAQTAIAAYWMLHGGPWIDYWTPVLGPPWSAPFEFPLYQWLIAAIAGATGLPLNGVGRAVSYLWLLASLPPALALFRAYRLPPLTGRTYVVLLLASPLYLFWGRAVLIETQAVALSLWFLWLAHRALHDGWRWTGAAALLGLAAALTKVTTWGPFLASAGVIALARIVAARRWPDRGRAAAIGLALALPGLLAIALWNHHADALKAMNPLTVQLRSDAPGMMTWNFGTLAQRFSVPLLLAQAQALMECLGLVGPPLLLVLGWLLRKERPDRRIGLAVGGLVALYLLPWLVLTNLHIVHNYYQSANALFLIAAVAVALAALGERQPGLAAALLAAFVLSQALGFVGQYGSALVRPVATREWAVAQALRAGTRPGEVVLTYGLDWSPLAPYEAGLLARMEPKWTTPAQFRPRLPLLAPATLDGRRIAAVVRCPSQVEDDPIGRARLIALGRAWRTVPAADCLVSFAPS